jgi:hypothetical protein
LTVKQPVQTAEPPSVFVTVTSPAPSVAAPEMVTLAVSCVDDTKVVEFTVIPVAEKADDAPVAKPVPVIVTLALVAPRPLELGLVDVTVGGALTVKHPEQDPLSRSVFVTVMFRVPVVAFAASVMLAVNEVGETKVVELTVIPVPENDATAPEANPVPVIVTLWLDVPCARDEGEADVTVGAGVCTTSTPSTVLSLVLVAQVPPMGPLVQPGRAFVSIPIVEAPLSSLISLAPLSCVTFSAVGWFRPT